MPKFVRTRTRALLAAMTLALLLGAVGCAPVFFAGPPSESPRQYDSSFGKQGTPLERQFPKADDASGTIVLGAPPATPWRPIADVAVHVASDEANAIRKLKEGAARFGADAVIKVAAGATRGVRGSAVAWSIPVGKGLTIGGSASSSTVTGTRSAYGTAIRRATPGSEAFTGIRCTNYTAAAPTVGAWHYHSFAYVTGVDGPAAKAGIRIGDLLLSVWDGTRWHASTCVELNAVLQRVGPRRPVTFVVLHPAATETRHRVQLPEVASSAVVREMRGIGTMVVALPAPGGASASALHEGDIVAASSWQKFLSAGAGRSRPVEVVRPGEARRVTMTLAAVPDDVYWTGSSRFQRASPPPVAAPTTAAPDASPRPAVPSGAGCTKDLDCKGARICVKRECADPPSK